jgi:hypothetical protein
MDIIKYIWHSSCLKKKEILKSLEIFSFCKKIWKSCQNYSKKVIFVVLSEEKTTSFFKKILKIVERADNSEAITSKCTGLYSYRQM